MVDLGRGYVTEAGLDDRVQLIEGNALDVRWPQADVVLTSYLLSPVGVEDIPVLLGRAASTLRGGGVLLLHSG